MASVIVSNPNRILSETSNGVSLTRYAKDFIPVPGVAETIGSLGTTDAYFRQGSESKFKIANIVSLYSSDDNSVTPWTYVADYSFHAYYPHAEVAGKTYYIHIRINSKNDIEFGIFDHIKDNGGFSSTYIFNKGVNKNLKGQLRIASKAESEEMMLTANRKKIKISSMPKYAGTLINETYTDKTPNGHATIVFGHIWTYWYTIISDTLYFIGFPLYQKNNKCQCPDGNGNIVDYDGPPNRFYTGTTFANALIKDEEFYNAFSLVKSDYLSYEILPIDAILEKYGDWVEPTVLQNKILAEISNDGKLITSYTSNDMTDSCYAHSSEKGGVYRINGELTILNEDTLSINYDPTKIPKELDAYNGFLPIRATHLITKSEKQTNGEETSIIYKSYLKEVYYTTFVNTEVLGNSYAISFTPTSVSFILDENGNNLPEREVTWLEHIIPNTEIPDPPDDKVHLIWTEVTGVSYPSNRECPPGTFMYKGECSWWFIYVGHNIANAITFS